MIAWHGHHLFSSFVKLFLLWASCWYLRRSCSLFPAHLFVAVAICSVKYGCHVGWWYLLGLRQRIRFIVHLISWRVVMFRIWLGNMPMHCNAKLKCQLSRSCLFFFVSSSIRARVKQSATGTANWTLCTYLKLSLGKTSFLMAVTLRWTL
jgi:hypothetical protein